MISKAINKTNKKIKLSSKRNSKTGEFEGFECNTTIEKLKNNPFNISYSSSKNEQDILKEIKSSFLKKYNHNLTDEEELEILNSIKNKSKIAENQEFECTEIIDFILLNKLFLKIAYETAYYVLGESYLKDNHGKKISEKHPQR